MRELPRWRTSLKRDGFGTFHSVGTWSVWASLRNAIICSTDRPKNHEEIFQREIKNNAWIEEHLSLGEQVGEYRITGEYSYRNQYCSMDGLVLAGDALGFLDLVFSSGVFLALKSGAMLADEVDAALSAGPITAQSFDVYGKKMQSSIETMRKIVYAFYDPEFSFGDLVKRGEHLRGALDRLPDWQCG